MKPEDIFCLSVPPGSLVRSSLRSRVPEVSAQYVPPPLSFQAQDRSAMSSALLVRKPTTVFEKFELSSLKLYFVYVPIFSHKRFFYYSCPENWKVGGGLSTFLGSILVFFFPSTRLA